MKGYFVSTEGVKISKPPKEGQACKIGVSNLQILRGEYGKVKLVYCLGTTARKRLGGAGEGEQLLLLRGGKKQGGLFKRRKGTLSTHSENLRLGTQGKGW